MARGVERRFGPEVVLRGASLDVRSGEVVGLVGANGSGKTTLLNVVAGLLVPDGGTVEVCGFPAGSRAARRLVTLVPDEPAGFDELTVCEHAALLGALYGAGEAGAARTEGLLDAFRLGSRRHVPVGALSHGLRRQAALAAAFAVGAPLVLVDEAAATLDPDAADILAGVVRGHAARAGAVVLATQDQGPVATACDRVLLLEGGTVGAAPSPAGWVSDGVPRLRVGEAAPLAAAASGAGDATASPR